MENFLLGIQALLSWTGTQLQVWWSLPVWRGFFAGYFVATIIFALIHLRLKKSNSTTTTRYSSKKPLIVLFCLFILVPQSVWANMGISPPEVTVQDILRDVPYVTSVYVYREFYDFDQIISVEFGGDDGRFLQGDGQFFMPAGMQRYEYDLTILPAGAAVGDYTARVDFTPQEPEEAVSDGTGVALRRGVSLILNFNVTGEQLIAYEVVESEFYPVEEESAVTVDFTLQNTGNVEWQPDEVVITITDPVTGEVVGTQTISSDDLPLLSPGETQIITQVLDIVLSEGEYTGVIDFYYESVLIASQTTSVSILKEGTLSQFGELTGLSTQKEIFTAGELGKFVGTFTNTGTTPYLATMNIEIYSLVTNSLSQVLVSDEQAVGPSETVTFDAVASLDAVGEYKAVALVEYGNKKSGTQEVTFQVEAMDILPGIELPTAIAANKWMVPAVATVLGGLVLATMTLIFVRHRRKAFQIVDAHRSPPVSGDGQMKVYVGVAPSPTAVVQTPTVPVLSPASVAPPVVVTTVPPALPAAPTPTPVLPPTPAATAPVVSNPPSDDWTISL